MGWEERLGEGGVGLVEVFGPCPRHVLYRHKPTFIDSGLYMLEMEMRWMLWSSVTTSMWMANTLIGVTLSCGAGKQQNVRHIAKVAGQRVWSGAPCGSVVDLLSPYLDVQQAPGKPQRLQLGARHTQVVTRRNHAPDFEHLLADDFVLCTG